MLPDPIYQHFGLMAVLVIAFGALLIISTVRAGRHVSFSRHAVSTGVMLAIFIASLSIGVILFEAFNVLWLSPMLALPWAFTATMSFALACTLLTAWLPARGGRVGDYHQITAYGILFSLPILVAFIANSQVVSTLGRYLATVIAATLLILLYLILFSQHSRRHYLVYQSAYLGLFFIGLLAPVYL